jgi:hypothetical protein
MRHSQIDSLRDADLLRTRVTPEREREEALFHFPQGLSACMTLIFSVSGCPVLARLPNVPGPRDDVRGACDDGERARHSVPRRQVRGSPISPVQSEVFPGRRTSPEGTWASRALLYQAENGYMSPADPGIEMKIAAQWVRSGMVFDATIS